MINEKIKFEIPDLTFPMVELGRTAIPWNLFPLLYLGGAGAHIREVDDLIETSKLGQLIPERIALVLKFHEEITSHLIGGGSQHTAKSTIWCVRAFYVWADKNNITEMTLKSVEENFRLWCDSLQNDVRMNSVKQGTAYGIAVIVSRLIDEVLERKAPLIRSTRLRLPKKANRTVNSIQGDKQNLSDTFKFGRILVELIEGLSSESIFGALPIKLPFKNGRVIELHCGLRKPQNLACLAEGYKEIHNTKKVLSTRLKRSNERTIKTRFPIVNTRIEAELLLFIAQTGMNLAQAYLLEVRHFSYKSTIDGYEVRDYKKRKKGKVLFEIFAEYKRFFESYLVWRKEIFPDSPYLFPFIRQGGASLSTAPIFMRISKICKELGVVSFRPQQLRLTRLNWLLRYSRDPDLTAEQAQHTKETLYRSYEKPSFQVAMVEIIQFWPDYDPSLKNNPTYSLVNGACNGLPKPISGLPIETPIPDCRNPSGCLFCAHHKDVDSEDYVWSLASMKYLKTLSSTTYRMKTDGERKFSNHVEIVIDVLSKKLKWFKESNETRKQWVKEAFDRIAESDYHPYWRYVIESAEGV